MASYRTFLLVLGRKGYLSSLKSHSNISAAIQNQFREMQTYHSTIMLVSSIEKVVREMGEMWSPERSEDQRCGVQIISPDYPWAKVTVGITSSTTDMSVKC